MSQTLFYSDYKFPIGELILGELKGKICLCDWRYRKTRPEIDTRLKMHFGTDWQREETDLIREAHSRLVAYFSGKRNEFDLPLLFAGTDFQKTVWNALLEIPYGKTISYLSLAKKLNNPGAIRAVAAANGANALSIFVPCHRVIGENKNLTGYAGGLAAKQKLLELEGSLHSNNQLKLFDI